MSERELNILEIAKEEILAKNIKGINEIAFLSAIIRGCGEILLSPKGFGVSITNDSKQLVELCKKIIKNRYQSSLEIINSEKNIGMRNLSLFRVTINGQKASKLLEDCQIIKGYDFIKGIPKNIISTLNDKRSYLKGIFLSCGYLSTPRDKTAKDYSGRKGYHLEFFLNSDLVLDDFMSLSAEICGFGDTIIRKRKNASSIYIKSAQSISDCLAAMGANNGVIMLQEIMANRAMRNHLNRGNNLILANIDKSLNAAQLQIEAIEKIDKNIGLRNIDIKLRQTAEIRLENPESTLSQLAEIVGNGSKSRINHHMRKIIKIAENL